MLTKEEIKKILSLKGEIRGVTFKTDATYVLAKKGEEGLKKVQAEMKKAGVKIDFDKIKNIDWYPFAWRVLAIRIIKDIFGWGDEELFDMGHSAPSNSFIVKILLRYFVSFRKTSEEAAQYWSKHYSVGKLETTEFDDKKKYVIYRLSDFKIHPDICVYLKGYFTAIAELTNKSRKITTKEIKCMFRGDPCHEFLINW